jgi:hypothetical protein
MSVEEISGARLADARVRRGVLDVGHGGSKGLCYVYFVLAAARFQMSAKCKTFWNKLI